MSTPNLKMKTSDEQQPVGKLSAAIDEINNAFTSSTKARLLSKLSSLSDDAIEWLTMEHYQFSFANKGLLAQAIEATSHLNEKGVSAELERNYKEEDGHAPMYKKGMLRVGTDFDARPEFTPTTTFLKQLSRLCSSNPSRVLGALYATETAAIFEHEVFYDICLEICRRRGATWEGSLIKKFHDIHLSEGVEQGHKDGLAAFVDLQEDDTDAKGSVNPDEVWNGAQEAIDLMKVWWQALVTQAEKADPAIVSRRLP